MSHFQTLLRLVARGNAIIAELLRLSDMIPPVFRLDNKDDQANYGAIVCDFSYFKVTDFESEFVRKLEQNMSLQDRDEELRENYIDILTRFYLAFESIHKYAFDLNRFVDDLEEGVYIQQTLDSMLLDSTESKQLLCEALYLCGVMLLIVDQKIEGIVRERLLVAYYRYSAQRTTESNIDDVCNLLRQTGLGPSRRPPGYPEEYFRRVRLNELYVNMVIGRLRSDDIYNLSSAFPLPDHRSTALATQASMLYIALFFAPDILNQQSAVMREIVDKVYMGMIVNLVEAWDPYRAAKQALNNTIDVTNLREQAVKQSERILKVLPQAEGLLKEGALTEESVLESSGKIMNLLRECNVTLRWLMLHTAPGLTSVELNNRRCKQIKDTVVAESKVEPLQVFRLLLLTAQLELKVKEIYQKLLKEKEQKWLDYRKEAVERVQELAEVFSGNKPLTRVERNANLEKWFNDISKQLQELTYDDSAAPGSTSAAGSEAASSTSRKTVQIIQAIEEIQDFHQLESNLQVKQYVVDVRRFLHCLLKTSAVKEEVQIVLHIIADLAYAWDIIDNYSVFMQQGIKRDPTLVIKLRATFLKLASALDIPLLRINQSGSPDLVSVSQHYSSELVAYVRKVLQIIPETMFSLMARIIELQTNQIKELPTRLMKDQMKHYSMLEQRHEVAKLTHDISVFTEGILMMDTTLVGIIQIDPKKLLEDGIRKELVRQVAQALHEKLVFNQKARPSELIAKLEELAQVIDGFRRSFEYIQDYVCIFGLKLWQEELSRIVNFNIEQECNVFCRTKVMDFESVYQSRAIPIPKFPPLDQYSVNFIGRLAREILRNTEPKHTIYVHQLSTWYDYKTHTQILSPRLFSLMMKSIGTAGVNGLDKLLSFMIMAELANIKKYIEKNVLRDKTWYDLLTALSVSLDDTNLATDGLIAQPSKVYFPLLDKAGKSWMALNDALMRCGQIQIIRSCIAHELNTSSKFESRHLASTLLSFNDSLINEIENHKVPLKEDSSLLFELSSFLEWTGLSDPLSKIYISTKPTQYIDLICFGLVVTQMGKFVYSRTLSALTAKRATDACDGLPYLIGFLTLVRQFNESVGLQFLGRASQYINSLLELGSATPSRTFDLPPEVSNLICFCDEFVRIAKLPRSFLQLSPYITDENQLHTGQAK